MPASTAGCCASRAWAPRSSTYLVTGEKVVRYTQVSVLAPVPGSPGQPATSAHITLITCTPVTLAFTPWRVIVTGVLVSTQAR
jgi:sortase (surface protein transpeptidase)